MFDRCAARLTTNGRWQKSRATSPMNRQKGTPDGDRFEVLLVLLASYEDRHYPIVNNDRKTA